MVAIFASRIHAPLAEFRHSESKPKTKSAPAMGRKTGDGAGAASSPRLRGLYQVASGNSILKIYISNTEKLNDLLS
jgi:hypothetical protein